VASSRRGSNSGRPSREVGEHIAKRINNNVRELEGVLEASHSDAKISKHPVDLSSAQQASRTCLRPTRNTYNGSIVERLPLLPVAPRLIRGSRGKEVARAGKLPPTSSRGTPTPWPTWEAHGQPRTHDHSCGA